MKNTKMFRVFVLVLALLACVSMALAGCTVTEDPDTSDSSTTQGGSTNTSVPGSAESTGTTDSSESSTDDSTDASTDASTDESTSGSTDESTSGSTDSSVENPEDKECAHTGGTATCTEKAVCDLCGEEYGELAEHEMVAGETVAPTCSTDGYTVYACDCGATENKDIVPAFGGECDWLFVGYDPDNMPTCDIEGIALYTCIVCDASKEVTALHRFTYDLNEYEVAPTCTEYGVGTFECLWCNERETRKVAPAHTYEMPTDTVNATCTTPGSSTWTCTVCGDVYVEVVPANGHNLKWQYDETTATCTEAGVEKFGCWNCTEIVEVEVEAYGHEWIVDADSMNLEAHTISRSCEACSTTETVSTYGMEEDPIVITVPGEFTANVDGQWVYYTFTQKSEGYLSFVFNTDNVNVMVKETNYKYDSQMFWGGETEFTAEIFGDGQYVIAVSSNDGAEVEIAITTTFEEADVPGAGETADKAILIESDNTAYYSTGKVWYTYEYTPAGATISFTIEGDAVVLYGMDPENLATYNGAFVEEMGYTTYYIVVESTEEVGIIVNLEFPAGSMDNPLEIVDGENEISYAGGFYNTYYAMFEAYQNGTLTLTFDAETNTQVVITYGTHPYMMYTSVENGSATIEVEAWATIYFGITTADWSAVDFTITASFEEVAVAPSEPEDELGEFLESVEIETTDNYTMYDCDSYTYTAVNGGTYTFFIPAGLGIWSDASKQENMWGAPEVDYYENATGEFVTVVLEAGATYKFWYSSTTKDTWTIDVYFYTEEASVEYNDAFDGIYVNDLMDPQLVFSFANGILVIEDTTGFFNISGEYTYGYNAELGEFVLDTDAFTLNVSSGTLFLNGMVQMVEYVAPTNNQAVIGENSVEFVCVNYRYGEEIFEFVAAEAGTYVISAAEGEENLYVFVEDAYGIEMVDVPYEFTLEAGESFVFIVSTGASVMTTTEDVVNFVISIKAE